MGAGGCGVDELGGYIGRTLGKAALVKPAGGGVWP